LFFDRTVRLHLSSAHRFVVALAAPGSSAPPDAGQPQGALKLACTVEARLIASSSELSISPGDWVAGQYVPPDPTTWTWIVTAVSSGTSEAVLQLKPVIRASQADGSVTVQDLRTEEFPVRFETFSSPGRRLADLWKQVVGGAAGLGAVLGLVLTARSIRNGRTAKADD
jgi:hypothetical protein